MTEWVSPASSPESKPTDPVTEGLGVPGEERRDMQAGPGRGYGIQGEDGMPLLYLETYSPGILRVTTPSARLELTGLSQPVVAAEGVVWEQGDSFVSVSRAGELTLHLSPMSTNREVEQAAPEAVSSAEGPLPQVEPVPVFTADSVPSQEPSVDTPVQPEKEERVKLFGRLGTDPTFRTTRNNKLIGQFPLAVRLDEETVKWEKIVAIGPRAEKLRNELKLSRGRAVEVIGYRHKEMRKDRKGNERDVEEIYVVAIIPR